MSVDIGSIVSLLWWLGVGHLDAAVDCGVAPPDHVKVRIIRCNDIINDVDAKFVDFPSHIGCILPVHLFRR